ncbi:MAG: SET domain-containing protein [Bacteroidota bacterium]|nr:SET domain-containing protein [Bacteroidota bacterium]
MKPINFLHPDIYVGKSGKHGRGVFTSGSLEADTVIEVAPVIVMPAKDRPIIDQTLLHDYIFEWGKTKKRCSMALGYVALYNHAYHSNCEYEMDFTKEIITVKTIKKVQKGEELFVNYNGDADNAEAVWFDKK